MTAYFLRNAALALGCAAALGATAAQASEQAKSVYLLGADASMAGMTPPPGFYGSYLGYFYSGSANGSTALSKTVPLTGVHLPDIATLSVNADLKIKANVAINIFSLLWVAPEKIFGGNFGIGVLLPVGYQAVDVDVTARTAITFPSGTVLQRGGLRSISDSTFTLGDPLATAVLGWSQGHWHWKLSTMVNIPVGDYNRSSLVNMGFNRWAADLKGSLTWLDPSTGFEVSMSSGFTFNDRNLDTKYRTGTEFHVEAAIMQHLSKDFALGLAGYHYQQVTGDSGPTAVLGAFKGRVSAIGPNLTYNFKVGDTLVLTSLRYMQEFNEKNRTRGGAGFLTVTIPFGGAPKH